MKTAMQHGSLTSREMWYTDHVHLAEEYEVTFLATPSILRRLAGVESTRIKDLYIPSGNEHPRIKLRYLEHGKCCQYLLVCKQPVAESGAVQWRKVTTVLTRQEYAALSGSNLCCVVIKDRYKIEVAGHQAHVYVYQGDLFGLVTVSFRKLNYGQWKDLSEHAPVGCLDASNTLDFEGPQLAGKHYRDLAEELRAVSYRKIVAPRLRTKH